MKKIKSSQLDRHEQELLRTSLLSDAAGNIQSLQGKAETTVNGHQVSDLDLVKEIIDDMKELKKLIKGDDVVWKN